MGRLRSKNPLAEADRAARAAPDVLETVRRKGKIVPRICIGLVSPYSSSPQLDGSDSNIRLSRDHRQTWQHHSAETRSNALHTSSR